MTIFITIMMQLFMISNFIWLTINGFIITTVLMTVGIAVISWIALPSSFTIFNFGTQKDVKNWQLFLCVGVGLWAGLIIGFVTEYYTSNAYRTGAATNVIFGLALGYKSVIIPIFAIAVSIFVSFSFAAMYDIAVAALGMLSTIATGLAIDAYGPISDNAGGIAEMAGMSHRICERTDALDAAGNTTAAIGKGFAIGSAALVSLALFGAFVSRAAISTVDVLTPKDFIGLIVGAMLPYWFSAMIMKSVGSAALKMVEEVRRQFNIFIYLFYQIAISASNTGGAWDNAKKYVEAGASEHARTLGPKGSEPHKAAVIGDTIGDPLKDTSGPSLNILIKLMAVESLVFAPFFATHVYLLLRTSGYDNTCKEIFKGWNCISSSKSNSRDLIKWRWKPTLCDLPPFDPASFLQKYSDTSIGFVGDSLNRNMFVSLFCSLRSFSNEVKKWRPAGADLGFTFLQYNLTIAYHRTNLLARYGRKYGRQRVLSGVEGSLGLGNNRVSRVGGGQLIPMVVVWNLLGIKRVIELMLTSRKAHGRMLLVKSPLLFFENGQPVIPPISPEVGHDIVLKHMVSFIEKRMRPGLIKFFRTQSPSHFEGGDWNQGGSCQRLEPLSPEQVEELFSLKNNGTNVEARLVNQHLFKALKGSDFRILDITRMSEFRADAHPSTAGGKKHDDCMHRCLPGITDTWNELFIEHLNNIKEEMKLQALYLQPP
ncbi:hypothetical protein FEM48_Zijuj09G0179900 [Ziziphus jujuba var. spinosa]|uniref:H(+)-exporting diphosphatase n=1 Tax=Ziziphus jujuba var. spinosa TaxID=714518 RepID=A0A978UUG5_ZIZJJ|nr:hypothetical protein FEM48_Zijuj09G0179900 [Ziziphus jujuba var. spinosa]